MALPQLLQNEDNPAIRQAIRADITPSLLPDVLIAAFYNTAAAQVVAVDTNAANWAPGSDEAVRDHDAAVMFAAAAVAASVPQLLRENFMGYSYGVQAFDPALRAEMLREMAYALLAQNLGQDFVTLVRPAQFALANGRRGDVSDDSWVGTFRVGTR